MDKVRTFGWVYFVGFMAIVALDFVPAFNDDQGRLFGLFTLDFYDNSLHFASGLWAAIAAWRSRDAARELFPAVRAALFPRRGDRASSLGSGYLDGGIFLYGAARSAAGDPLLRQRAASDDRRHRHLGRLRPGPRRPSLPPREEALEDPRSASAACSSPRRWRRSPMSRLDAARRRPGSNAEAPFRSRLPAPPGRRPEARTWLTYPEWHIVYSAETYGRYLAAGNRPSGFATGGRSRGFWSAICALEPAPPRPRAAPATPRS